MSLAKRLFILLAFLIAGCAHTEPAPAHKDLRTLPEFLLLDDFNNPELKNRFGEPWVIEGGGPEKFKAEFVSEDAIQETRGNSLLFHLNLGAGEKGVFKSTLRGLDASQTLGLALKCRLRAGGLAGALQLSLKDVEGRIQTFDLTSACLSPDSSSDWRDAVIPRVSSSPLDWNKLQEIQFVFTGGEKPLKAQAAIDELALYGKGDVGFLSKKDNLIGFPTTVQAEARRKELLAEPESEKFLYEIARDTWKYFENAVDRTTQLPVDHIRVGAVGDVGSYTTPTNLAMYFLACVSAYELGFIPKKEAVRRIEKTFQTLRQIKRWKGFHYNFYNTATLQVTRDYISTVDAGWLAAAWMVIRQAFPKELGPAAARFLDEIDFYEFYDDGIGQVRLGFDGTRNDYAPYHYGLIATEARVMSFIGIGKKDIPREHWWFIYRTPPEQWSWQSQAPQGKEVEIERVSFFQGYYTYQGRKFVPSWGGSLFEFLMPALVLKEKELAPQSFGRNNRVATEIQIDYALNRQGYPVWGFSPASTSSGREIRYAEYGVKYLGVKGYRDEGVISPHASILALDTLPDQVIDNLRRMLEFYEVYGEYGLYDSINVRTGRVSTQYLALDQGMILAAIANYLRNGVIQEHFHRDPIAKEAETLLGLEEWVK